MSKVTILWVDDEIDMLKSQMLFLEEKGYRVDSATNGQDAIEKCGEANYDIVFLDEQMPGLSGLETLSGIKEKRPSLPVVMITKSEEENLMEEAIGAKISDYLIKPVNPKQVLLTIKKNLDNKRLITEKSTMAYQQEFRKISMELGEATDAEDWTEIYNKLVYWELELEKSEDQNVAEILEMQKKEANKEFNKFIKQHYLELLETSDEEGPTMSHNLLAKQVFPKLEEDRPVFVLLIDNLRLDQWKTLQPVINEYFRLEEEDLFYSILPTTTQYSRNAIFAGMMPGEIAKHFPRLWKDDEEEGGKNNHEADFLENQVKRSTKNIDFTYHKIVNLDHGRELVNNLNNLLSKDLNVIVYNFVDMLSHARTEMEMLKELANDEPAYRALTRSWFEHSPLLDLIKKLAEEEVHLIITTDHGTIRVQEPSKVIGDRNTTTNLRYKNGKNLQYDPEDVLAFKNPPEAKLPRPHVSSAFIFAMEQKYFVYPNNYNYYVNFFRNTFQHGGISLEEMIVPVVHYRTA